MDELAALTVLIVASTATLAMEVDSEADDDNCELTYSIYIGADVEAAAQPQVRFCAASDCTTSKGFLQHTSVGYPTFDDVISLASLV